MHPPVERLCNIRCRYCSPWPDKSLPGGEALGIARACLRESPQGVVGVASPGDPLANPEMLELFEVIRGEFPHARLCLCTNGMELPSHIGRLVEIGLNALTVTVNAVRLEVGAMVYEWVAPKGGPVLSGSARGRG